MSLAHVCASPAAISTAPAMPVTVAGLERLLVVPSPGCPLVLFPQQSTLPLELRAHVWSLPALSSTMRVGTHAGDALAGVAAHVAAAAVVGVVVHARLTAVARVVVAIASKVGAPRDGARAALAHAVAGRRGLSSRRVHRGVHALRFVRRSIAVVVRAVAHLEHRCVGARQLITPISQMFDATPQRPTPVLGMHVVPTRASLVPSGVAGLRSLSRPSQFSMQRALTTVRMIETPFGRSLSR